MTASPTDDLASAERRIGELTKELSEAREQQAATSEILRVISSSPTDPRRVFAEIAGSAAHLCDAYDAVIRQVDGEVLRLVAHHGPIPTTPVGPLSRGAAPGRAVLDRQTIHIADLQAETGEYPEGSERARRLGFRATLSVPLIRAGEAIGVIVIRRIEAHPFTDRQIELLKIFADQAVIAIENTRLFEAEQDSKREVQQSLEYQTAISEVLNVISRSPSDIQPVLDTIVQTAERLCEPDYAVIFKQADDGIYHLAANSNASPAFVEWLRDNPIRAGDGSVVGIVLVEKRTVHLPDALADARFTDFRRLRQANARTLLAVPLLREGNPIGVINLLRRKVQPFSQKQIDLVTTFADQAVIAIENARLFEEVQTRTRELAESLEYQTATSEVLSVISRSPSELQPVVDAIVQTAKRLCSAERAAIWRWREGKFDLLAHTIIDPALAKYLKENPIPSDSASLAGRAVLEGRTMHVPDLKADPELGRQDQIIIGGIRTLLVVPLLRKGEPIGVLSLSKSEVQPFSEKQMELVTTFADQAVIAIENARLFEAEQGSKRELTEAPEQQTATADVLQVISRSALDVQKVL